MMVVIEVIIVFHAAVYIFTFYKNKAHVLAQAHKAE